MKITILSLLLSFGSLACYGQQIKSDTLHAVSLGEIVISANKKPESNREVPSQMLVIDARKIAELQAQNSADLLSRTGMVSVQKSQQGGGSPVLRGFEASRVLLMVDGVRMNNIIYRGGHLQNILTIDNSMLDRVEVLYGPSSTIYGSDALGGVVHFYSRAPRFNTDTARKYVNANAFYRYSSVNAEMTNHVDFSLGWKRLATVTSLTWSNFGNLKGGSNQNPFYTTSYGERPCFVVRKNGQDTLMQNDERNTMIGSAYTQWDVLQKFAFKQNAHLIHGLNIQLSSSSNIPRYDRLTDPSGSGLKYAEWYYGPQDRLLTAYNLEYDNSESFFQKASFGLNYQHIEESRNTRRFGKDNRAIRTENVDVMGLTMDLERSIKKHVLHVGLDGYLNGLKSQAEEQDIITGLRTPLDTRYPDGDNSMMNLGLYLSHKWNINDELTITDGVRVEAIDLKSTFNDTTFFKFPYDEVHQSNTAVSGNIGIIHSPNENTKLSALFSTGFRAPNVDDLSKVFESGAGQIIVPNNDLKPEKTINTELGITRILNNHTRWESNLYYTRFIDAIVTDAGKYQGADSIQYDGTLSQVLMSQNKGEAYVYGLSSSIYSQYDEHFSFGLCATYTYGRIKTDSSDAPLDHIPPFFARMNLSYTNKHFKSDFFINYNGWKRLKDYYLNGEDNEQYATPEGMPAWFTANFHVSYEFRNHIVFQSGVENIFDTQYRTFASGINAPGRNFFLTIRFKY